MRCTVRFRQCGGAYPLFAGKGYTHLYRAGITDNDASSFKLVEGVYLSQPKPAILFGFHHERQSRRPGSRPRNRLRARLETGGTKRSDSQLRESFVAGKFTRESSVLSLNERDARRARYLIKTLGVLLPLCEAARLMTSFWLKMRRHFHPCPTSRPTICGMALSLVNITFPNPIGDDSTSLSTWIRESLLKRRERCPFQHN